MISLRTDDGKNAAAAYCGESEGDAIMESNLIRLIY